MDYWNEGIAFFLHLFFSSVECTNNTYGQDCLYACGSCIKLEQCDVVNGSCSNGCDGGFMGDKCVAGTASHVDSTFRNLPSCASYMRYKGDY